MLDPIGRRIVRRLLEELRGRGVSVLLNSHLLSEVELVSDRVYILSHGQVVTAGPPASQSSKAFCDSRIPPVTSIVALAIHSSPGAAVQDVRQQRGAK